MQEDKILTIENEQLIKAPPVQIDTALVDTNKAPQFPLHEIGFASDLLSAWHDIPQTKNLNAFTDMLLTLRRLKDFSIDSQNDIGVVKRKDYTFTLKNFSTVQRYGDTTSQLLDVALMLYLDQKREGTLEGQEVTFPISHFAKYRGVELTNYFKKQTSNDLIVLRAIDYDAQGDTTTFGTLNEAAFYKANYDANTGLITIGFGSIKDLINNGGYLAAPSQVMLSIDTNTYRYAYKLARKFTYIKAFKLYYDQPNQDIFEVETILEWLYEYGFPTIESVKKSRRYKELIIKPLVSNIKALRRNEIEDIFFINQEGGRMSDDEVIQTKIDTFKKLKIRVVWNEYPVKKEGKKQLK